MTIHKPVMVLALLLASRSTSADAVEKRSIDERDHPASAPARKVAGEA